MHIENNPIICALDTKNIAEATRLCSTLHPYIGAIKLGLEFFISHGADGVRALTATGVPVFLDLKLHDIPNTVAEAVRAATALDIAILTVHTQGGVAMMQAAAHAARDEAKKRGKTPPIVVGVTILTSLDNADIQSLGLTGEVSDAVENLALKAKDAGLDGVVCSPHEIALVKRLCGKSFKTIVPGIRPIGTSQDDQKRTLTPKEAILEGADYLVIGRPITKADSPEKAAKAILETLQ